MLLVLEVSGLLEQSDPGQRGVMRTIPDDGTSRKATRSLRREEFAQRWLSQEEGGSS